MADREYSSLIQESIQMFCVQHQVSILLPPLILLLTSVCHIITNKNYKKNLKTVHKMKRKQILKCILPFPQPVKCNSNECFTQDILLLGA